MGGGRKIWDSFNLEENFQKIKITKLKDKKERDKSFSFSCFKKDNKFESFTSLKKKR